MLRAQGGPTVASYMLYVGHCEPDLYSSYSCDCAVAEVDVTISADRTRATRAIGLHVTHTWAREVLYIHVPGVRARTRNVQLLLCTAVSP